MSTKAHRPRAALALGALAVLAVACLVACARMGAAQEGQFRIDAWSSFACGGQSTRAIHLGRRTITRYSFDHAVNPHTGRHVLFDVSPSCAKTQADAGLFLFDALAPSTMHLSGSAIPLSAPGHLFWSPDGRHAAANGLRDIAYLVDLEKGKSLELASFWYDGKDLRRQPDIAVKGWSPDSRQAAVVLGSMFQDTESGTWRDQTDLVSLSLPALNVAYVATLRPDEWDPEDFSWEAAPDGFRLVAAPRGPKAGHSLRRDFDYWPAGAR